MGGGKLRVRSFPPPIFKSFEKMKKADTVRHLLF